MCIPLLGGSFYLMSKGFQSKWEHAIPKCRENKGQQISLTFRKIPDPGTEHSSTKAADARDHSGPPFAVHAPHHHYNLANLIADADNAIAAALVRRAAIRSHSIFDWCM